MKTIVTFLALGAILFGATVLAQVVGGSTISSKGPSGEEFLFRSQELVVPESGLLSEAMYKGIGQLVHQKGNDLLLLTAESVLTIERDKIILMVGDKNWDFVINDHTIFCDGRKPIGWKNINPGDAVTVVSRADAMRVALSIRKGPLLVSSAFGGSPAPVNFDCDGVRKKSWQFWK